MTPGAMQRAADTLTRSDLLWERHLGAWLQAVAVSLLTGRMSAGCSEACHAARIAAALGERTPA